MVEGGVQIEAGCVCLTVTQSITNVYTGDQRRICESAQSCPASRLTAQYYPQHAYKLYESNKKVACELELKVKAWHDCSLLLLWLWQWVV